MNASGSLPPWAAGLAACVSVAALARLLADVVPGPGFVTWSLLLGLAAGNVMPLPKVLKPGVVVASKRWLNAAVVGMGVGLDLSAFAALGVGSALGLVGGVAAALGMGVLAAPLLGLPVEAGWLLGIGTAICGSSAIAAAAPLVAPDDDGDVGLAVGVVNLLGTVGIALLPLVATALALTQTDTSMLLGGSLQAVGHVAAAGYAMDAQIGELAVAIKLARVAMLVPLVALLGVVFRREGSTAIPPYLVGFAGLVVLSSLGVLPDEVVAWAKWATKFVLAVAMAGIGMKIHLATLLRQGPKAVAVGVLAWAAQIAVILGALLLL